MNYILLGLYFVLKPWVTLAADSLEGLGELVKPCFGTVHDMGCNSSIPEVFTPRYRGAANTDEDTKVFLFTPTNPDKAELLHRCGGKLPKKSNFDSKIPLKVVIHGLFDGVCRSAWMREMKKLLFSRSKYNVILVDWTWGNNPDVASAAANAKVVGQQMAFVLLNIMNQTNINGNKIHIIGQSFGAIASSKAGKVIRRFKREKIGRLSYMDAAGFPYKNNRADKYYSQRDAKFIDAIHTNAGGCFPATVGALDPIGHLDFYPNGGTFQPSCVDYALRSTTKGDLIYSVASLYPPLCNHLQSIQFFKETILHLNGQYVGVECNSYEDFQSGACQRCCKKNLTNCAVAGLDAEYYYKQNGLLSVRKKYFFKTSNICPYKEDYAFSIFKNC